MNRGEREDGQSRIESGPKATPVNRSGEEGIHTAGASALTPYGGVHPTSTTALSSPTHEKDVSDTPLTEYRRHCVSAEQKAQEDYDKSVLTLSGGALGVSFAFLKDVVGPGALLQPNFLLWAWLSWSASIVSTLASFWFSQLALRTAIAQVDTGTIHDQFPGRAFSRITSTLNAIGGLAFVVGVVLMVVFVMANLKNVHH
jgi:hypothetical protein